MECQLRRCVDQRGCLASPSRAVQAFTVSCAYIHHSMLHHECPRGVLCTWCSSIKSLCQLAQHHTTMNQAPLQTFDMQGTPAPSLLHAGSVLSGRL